MIQQVYHEEVDAQTLRLEFLLRLLDRMLSAAIPAADQTAANTLLFASVLKVQQSARAIQLLAREGYVEDIVSLGRTLIEITINAAYLQHSGPADFERYLTFHPEFATRRTTLGFHKSPTLIRWMAEFLMGTVGRQPSAGKWTSSSIFDRARISDTATNRAIMLPMLRRCYFRGQAAVSGTMGALENFIGALESGHLPNRQDRLSELFDALFNVNLTLLTLCLFLDHDLLLGMEQAIKDATSATSTSRPALHA